MSNKTKLKKYLIISLIVALCILILFSLLNIIEYRVYTKNFNQKLNEIVTSVIEKYPDVSENELIELLNGNRTGDQSVLDKYGINIENDSVVLENIVAHRLFLIINTVLLLCGVAVLLFVFLKYDRRKSKDIADITRTIEQINKRNYELDIDSISEDELSILKNEIYKTTVTLREAADNSNAVITMEQVYEWNPDMIVITNFTQTMPDDLYNNAVGSDDWSTVAAVQNHEVYKMPLGTYRTYTPGVDTPMTLQWLAKKAYPDLFADVDLAEEVRNYYNELYGITVTDEQMEAMYNPAKEAGSWK